MTITETIKDAHFRLLNLIADEIAQNYSDTCPVDTGRLRDNCRAEITDNQIDIYLQFYWKYIEWDRQNGAKGGHYFENAFNNALDSVLLDYDGDDEWLLYAKMKLNANKHLLKLKIIDTHIE